MLRTHQDDNKGKKGTGPSDEPNSLQFPKVDDDRNTVVVAPDGRALHVQALPGHPVKTAAGWGRPNIRLDSNNRVTVTGADQVIEVPVPGDRYLLQSTGTDCYTCEAGAASLGCAGIVAFQGTTQGPIEVFGAPDGLGKSWLHVFGSAAAGYFYLIHILD